MKILLAILCGLMVLFSGGCALLFLTGAGYNGMFQSIPGAVIPGGIALMNVLVLVALFGTSKPHLWAFYVLAVLDALVVLAVLVLWIGNGFADSDVNMLAGLTALGFGAKGLLTVLAARRPGAAGGAAS